MQGAAQILSSLYAQPHRPTRRPTGNFTTVQGSRVKFCARLKIRHCRLEVITYFHLPVATEIPFQINCFISATIRALGKHFKLFFFFKLKDYERSNICTESFSLF